ncbi:MAG: pyrroline-5-carboxylate reductase [Deltaproteobacteria bacterium]|nr:pyrroline-5-carboxylate reductase [Deltaproteobacteria bacterium]
MSQAGVALREALGQGHIGFVGGGAMGAALAGGVLAAGLPAAQLRVADPDPARRGALAGELGIETLADNSALLAASDVVVLAVKPGLLRPVLAALRGDLARPLWISVAAGISLQTLGGGLPPGARVVRAMPNTPALIGAGACGFAAGAACGAADREIARALFSCVGLAWEAPSEALLDAVTGLSGSGPAFALALLEALAEAGAALGLPPEAAERLAGQTLLGAALLAQQSALSPAELRAQVTSPGGTTEAGLARLAAGNFAACVGDAVRAAARRSQELGEMGAAEAPAPGAGRVATAPGKVNAPAGDRNAHL